MEQNTKRKPGMPNSKKVLYNRYGIIAENGAFTLENAGEVAQKAVQVHKTALLQIKEQIDNVKG